MIKKIPKEVIEVLKKLEKAGFKAYIVGGCVRDLFMDREPKDWDVATNAKPVEIQKFFPDSFYENDFGTVGIKTEKFIKNGNPDRDHDVVEATTFRVESEYSDRRRPDEVKFAKTLEEDLERRDFTINAMALKLTTHNLKLKTQKTKSKKSYELQDTSYEIIDPFEGQKDLKDKIIRAVGIADERFNEDALRMMRAVRFFSELNFVIEKKTKEAIKKNAKNLKFVSLERIKDELARIILSDNPARNATPARNDQSGKLHSTMLAGVATSGEHSVAGGPSEGIEVFHETGLLEYILPELEKGVGVKQNRHHIYTIYQHSVLSLKHCPSKKLEVRLAALLHDIAKPQTKRGEGEFATFYNHDHMGARIVEKILTRLRFSSEIIKKVKLLVDQHMFYYNPEEVGESSVRRLIQKVGLENMKDLIDLRISDRLGSGVLKAKPYKLRHLEYVIEKVSRDAVSVKMLKINGNDLIKELKITPGPKIGAILDVLLAEVIEDASKNNKKALLERAEVLEKENFEKLRQMAKVKIEEKKEEEDKKIKSKYWVK
ncbi:MAG: hypothetical protein COU40_00350 [Candidatus Moranbacteria bacterium CG10_big_fil_rev_8_21_14_0_10_35_21]|nr:MAG: hypothetical protein COU40_00350 [Candidatus Moranbacteria bacterium CG10_big_fil_rev_8_21_14_0_10_35_21]PJA88344.1 MAG: hypothetical protein CO139_03660 [Candidatus Moranbacteria bacterium CG_4_9_14_3_um_filter_36_9]